MSRAEEIEKAADRIYRAVRSGQWSKDDVTTHLLALPPDPPGEEFRRGAEAMRQAIVKDLRSRLPLAARDCKWMLEQTITLVVDLPLPGAKEGT